MKMTSEEQGGETADSMPQQGVAESARQAEDGGDAASRSVGSESNPREEAARYRDLALRSQAELDNFRKRMAREKEEAIRFANASLIERLLPVMDSFELGLRAAAAAADSSAIHEGMTLVHRQLAEFLKDQGVEPVDAEGAPFDPNVHEAVGHEACQSVPEGHVVRQMRKGYKLRERLIRPAMVVVSKGPGSLSAEQ